MMLTFTQYGHLLLWIAVPALTIICVEFARLADYYSSSVRKKRNSCWCSGNRLASGESNLRSGAILTISERANTITIIKQQNYWTANRAAEVVRWYASFQINMHAVGTITTITMFIYI